MKATTLISALPLVLLLGGCVSYPVYHYVEVPVARVEPLPRVEDVLVQEGGAGGEPASEVDGSSEAPRVIEGLDGPGEVYGENVWIEESYDDTRVIEVYEAVAVAVPVVAVYPDHGIDWSIGFGWYDDSWYLDYGHASWYGGWFGVHSYWYDRPHYRHRRQGYRGRGGHRPGGRYPNDHARRDRDRRDRVGDSVADTTDRRAWVRQRGNQVRRSRSGEEPLTPRGSASRNSNSRSSRSGSAVGSLANYYDRKRTSSQRSSSASRSSSGRRPASSSRSRASSASRKWGDPLPGIPRSRSRSTPSSRSTRSSSRRDSYPVPSGWGVSRGSSSSRTSPRASSPAPSRSRKSSRSARASSRPAPSSSARRSSSRGSSSSSKWSSRSPSRSSRRSSSSPVKSRSSTSSSKKSPRSGSRSGKKSSFRKKSSGSNRSSKRSRSSGRSRKAKWGGDGLKKKR